MYTGFEAEPHTDIFVTLCWSHTINRFSRLPSVALLFTGFRAIPVPVIGDDPVQNLGVIRRLPWYIVYRQRSLVFAPTDYCKPTGDERPFQNFSAGTLLADRLGQYAIGDKPLRKRWTLQALALLRATGTVHVVIMQAIAGTGFEPVASRL